jgi:rubrerythrin
MGGFTYATAALASIKNTYDLASAALGVKEGVKRDLALADILPKMLEAQRAANEAVENEMALYEEISRLKEEIRQLKAQRGQVEEYERRRFFPGSIAYVRKDVPSGGAVAQYACATCYEDRDKVISLQPTGQLGNRRHPMHRCPSCKSEVQLGPEMRPDEPSPAPVEPRKIDYGDRGIV